MDKEEKNDEITIDFGKINFGKIKGFFKKKKEDIIKEKAEPKETEVKEKQDKEIEVTKAGESKEIKDKKPKDLEAKEKQN